MVVISKVFGISKFEMKEIQESEQIEVQSNIEYVQYPNNGFSIKIPIEDLKKR